MKVTLLDKVPEANSFLERHFDKSNLSNTWVLFDNEKGNKWVGVFGNSETAHFSTAVLFSDDDNTALVVATGQGYIINTLTGNLIRKTPWSYSYSALNIPGKNYVLIADTQNIWACYQGKDILVRIRTRFGHLALSGDVALDGILFRNIESDFLNGYAWQGDYWNEFKLHIDDLILEYGHKEIHDNLFAIPDKGGYPYDKQYLDWMKKFFLK